MPGEDVFWEQADQEGSAEHPLERELCARLDALARYCDMIAEAQATGIDEQVDQLLLQHSRVERQVERLRAALSRV